MKKTNIKQNINEIKKISSKFPKSLNEALNFNEVEDDNEEIGFEDEEEPEVMHEHDKIVTNATRKQMRYGNNFLSLLSIAISSIE